MKTVLPYLFISCCLLIRCNTVEHDTFKYGPHNDPGHFPIAVWLQDPADAPAYRDAGINLYIGLWQGPTEDHLNQLRSAGMKLMCQQNEVALRHLDDSLIVGWIQEDEPDNAQADGSGGYDPCIDPALVIEEYNKLRQNDTTRPVYLNLGMGVAYQEWVGRGECFGDTLSYPEYAKAADIISYDIYPVTSRIDAVKNNLWYVPKGVDNLRRWTGDEKPVWCWIECTHIGSNSKPTPAQVKAEVWMALIHGAKGFGYFCHEWYPEFNPNAPIDDTLMLSAIKEINSQIQALAPVINGQELKDRISVKVDKADVPIAITLRQYANSIYIFAVAMRSEPVAGTFSVSGLQEGKIEVLGEERSLSVKEGGFEDSFQAYEVHLYKLDY